MKIDFKQFITSDFWFQIDRTLIHKSEYAAIVTGGVLLLLSLAIYLYARTSSIPQLKAWWNKIATVSLITGLLSGLWFGLRYEAIRFFGSRFILGLIFGAWVIRIAYLIYVYFVKMGKQKLEWQKEQAKLKYLPKQR